MSTDPEHKFELALQLGEVKIAYELALEAEVRALLSREHENKMKAMNPYSSPVGRLSC